MSTEESTIETADVNGEDSNTLYKGAEEYWQNIKPDEDGMLGGFSHLSQLDVADSHKFLRKLQKQCGTSMSRALDCGAGIGRVSKQTLLPVFETVDMVDVIDTFIQQSADYLGDLDSRVEKKFVCGLQNFTPENDRYDVIWVQWVSGHLTDKDFVQFFSRCRAALRPNGCVVLKENVCPREDTDFDEEDKSWTRPHAELLRLFEEAGCKVVIDQKHQKWPKNMYTIHTSALQ